MQVGQAAEGKAFDGTGGGAVTALSILLRMVVPDAAKIDDVRRRLRGNRFLIWRPRPEDHLAAMALLEADDPDALAVSVRALFKAAAPAAGEGARAAALLGPDWERENTKVVGRTLLWCVGLDAAAFNVLAENLKKGAPGLEEHAGVAAVRKHLPRDRCFEAYFDLAAITGLPKIGPVSNEPAAAALTVRNQTLRLDLRLPASQLRNLRF